MRRKLEVLKVKAEIVQADGVGAFAFYEVGSRRGKKGRRSVIGLNVEAFVAAVALGQVEKKDVPYLVAESIMHEVMHVLEDWAKAEFSHRRINRLIADYRKRYKEIG
jgi:DNA-binding ferritin-like protein (Dps family)